MEHLNTPDSQNCPEGAGYTHLWIVVAYLQIWLCVLGQYCSHILAQGLKLSNLVVDAVCSRLWGRHQGSTWGEHLYFLPILILWICLHRGVLVVAGLRHFQIKVLSNPEWRRNFKCNQVYSSSATILLSTCNHHR